MEELSFGGVVRKKWHDVGHPKVHYPTNFQTPKSKKKFGGKGGKGIFEQMSVFSIVFNFSNRGVIRKRSCP